MERTDGIGLNIARLRIVAGWTQQRLADATGFTQPYISMIESGTRTVDNRRRLGTFADALGVSINDLTGQPYPARTATDLDLVTAVPLIRAALQDPDDRPPATRPLAALDRACSQAMIARMDCDMAALAKHLPGVLTETRILWYEKGDRAAGETLVKAAVTGSLALKAAGWVDLSARLAELAETVAISHGDPVCVAAAQFAVAQNALAVGARRTSARIAADGAAELDRLTRRTNLPPMLLNDITAWMGMLHLHAALSQATLEGGDPDPHLTEAAAAVRHVTGNPWYMEATPANVQVWGVGIALENGNPDQAPQLARRVDPGALLTKQRRSRLHLDAGRGAFAAGDITNAIRLLLLADRAAPGDLRQRATAVEIVRNLVAETPASDDLRELARRVGVDSNNPDINRIA